MFSDIQKQYGLKCSEDEFYSRMNKLISSSPLVEIALTKHSFDELYNGNKIENIFQDDNARYYILDINGWNTYLQYHIPYIGWMEMITDDNFEDISSNHCSKLSDEFIQMKAFNDTIDYFKSK